MIYVNGNIVLTDEERKALSLATWNDSIDSECDAHEFVQSMKENIVWANAEILNIQKVEQGERKKLLVQILQLAINSFERFEMMAHKSARAAGASLSQH